MHMHNISPHILRLFALAELEIPSKSSPGSLVDFGARGLDKSGPGIEAAGGRIEEISVGIRVGAPGVPGVPGDATSHRFFVVFMVLKIRVHSENDLFGNINRLVLKLRIVLITNWSLYSMSTLFDRVCVNRSAFLCKSCCRAQVHYRVNGNLNLSRSIGDLEYKCAPWTRALRQLLKHHSTFMLYIPGKILDDCREEPWKNTEEPDEVALIRFGHESG